MKFLVINSPKAAPPPTLPADMILLYQASNAYINGALATHQLDCCYALVNGGGVSIANAGSVEELVSALWAYPMWGYFEWSIKPLADVNAGLDKSIELWKKFA